jgi:ribose transport system substrate-binding protein
MYWPHDKLPLRVIGKAGPMKLLSPQTAIAAALLFVLGGCTSVPHDAKEKYVLVATNVKLPYWQAAQNGLMHAVGELKVKGEMIGPDTYDIKAQHDEFRRALGEKPAGIMVSASDANVLQPDINEAIAQGIPVVTIDSDAPTSKRLLFIGTDNYNAGVLGGKLAVKLLNGHGNVVVFTMPNQDNLKDRLQGYQSVFASNPGIKVVQTIDIKGDPTVAFDGAKELLSGKNKVDGIICLEAIACPEVGEVINRNNMGGKVVVIGMDTDARTISWIQKGIVSATIAQKPYTMAYFGVRTLADIHLTPIKDLLTSNWTENSSAPVPTFVDTGTFVINKDNVANFTEANAQK